MNLPESLIIAARENALPLIKHFENCSLRPYWCPAGKPTIGFGCTRHPDGTPVKMTDRPLTANEAENYLDYAIERVVLDLEPALVRVPTPNQLGALISLAYNVGVGCHDGVRGDLADSTLLARFNAGDIAGAAAQFIVWDKARIKGELTTLDGLARRRIAERELFLKPETRKDYP